MAAYYAEDLAYIHDAGYVDIAKAAAADLQRRLRKAGIHDGHIVSLGCGSGILLEHFVQRGFLATGIDISADMLNIARKRLPAVRFEHGSYRDVRIPSCEVVVAIGEVLNYRADGERKGVKSLRKLFGRVHQSLRPGGLFMFDLAGPKRSAAPSSKIGWREEEDWSAVWKVRTKGKLLTRHIVTFRKLVHMYRRHEETHLLRLYKSSRVQQLLRDIGFRVKTIDRYGELQLPKGLVGFVAEKQ